MLIFSVFSSNAQDKKTTDKVILKGGSIIYGQLIDYKYGESIKFKMEDGSIISFPDSVIQNVETNINHHILPNSKIDKKGLFSYIGFKILPGKNNYYTSNNGLGIEYTLGYRKSDYFSLGLGLGVETYNYGYDEVIIPVFLDFMSYSNKGTINPFLRFQVGYGFIDVPKDKATSSNGGLMLDPAFGVRLWGNYTFDFNFKYQKAYINDNSKPNRNSSKDITFMRFSFRFGVIF